MGKKLSRAKRKELREQGLLEAPPRVAAEPVTMGESPKPPAQPARTERRAPAAARSAAPREEIAEEEEAREAPRAQGPRRDRTMLVLLALTAGAALIFWLTQRSPTKASKMIDVPPPMSAATGAAKP